jgi:hypothetical protein
MVKGKNCYASGGMIPGEEVYPWDDTANDTVQINASPGEIVIPKSIANDPLASAQFVDRENRKQIQAARSQQDMMGLGNVLGKAATDYGNSQNQGVVLANRIQDLGQKPAMYQTEKKQFDSSVLDNLGKMGVDRASEDANKNDRALSRNIEYGKMAEENKFKAGMRDPNSQESIAAREYLKKIMPTSSAIQGFENLSAEQVGRIAPSYKGLYELDQKAIDRKEIRAGQMAQNQARKEENDLRRYEADKRFDLMRQDKQESKAEKDAVGTTVQQTSRGFGKRMEDANAIFDKIEKAGYDRSSTASGLGSILPNQMRSANAQMQDQAERNFVNALLRKESGAAIGKEEFNSAEIQYFPRAGDTPEVIAQKKANRERAIDTLKRESGKTWDAGKAQSDQTGATGSWRDEL